MMKEFLSTNRGSTLYEMTIVLIIISVASSISIIQFNDFYETRKRQEFIHQLTQDLYYAQQKAISNELISSMSILNGSKEYVIRQKGEPILKRGFPKNVTFVPVTLALNDIAFLQDGNARKSGTLLIEMGNYRYRLVVLLGRGRFYIEQL